MDQAFVADYAIFTFVCCVGTLILSLAKNPNSRLNFIKNKKPSSWLGLILIVVAYVWFFGVENRNVHTVIEGAQLFFIFGLSAFAVLILAKFIVSKTRKL